MTVAELTERFFATAPGRMVLGMLHINIVDRALALSSKAFVVLIPVTIITGAVVEGESSGEELVDRFGLTGAGADAAETLFESPDVVRAGISIFGIGFLLFGALSLARGLERIYLDAWDLEAEAGSVLRRLGWIASAIGFISLADPIRSLFAGLQVGLTLGVVNVALSACMWMWTPYVLLGLRVAARTLVPTGLLTAAGTTALGIASLVYMPALATTNAERYGLIGVAFALVSWLFTYACVIIAAAVVAAVLAGRNPVGDAEATRRSRDVV